MLCHCSESALKGETVLQVSKLQQVNVCKQPYRNEPSNVERIVSVSIGLQTTTVGTKLIVETVLVLRRASAQPQTQDQHSVMEPAT